MCGITGFWSADGITEQASEHLKRMTATLHHRGPDGYGFHIDPQNGLAMGHARLSIIDLNTGEQPLYSMDKKSVLTVNGEFYDYKRIRTELRLDGFNFRTKSDSEIALPLYQKHGLSFVQHLRGEFAVAMYDAPQDRMILIRDRFGIKPLFYTIRNNTLIWGSEMKSLFAHPDVRVQFDSTAVLHQLMHTMVPGTSAFKGIHALKPGHMIIVQRNGSQLEVSEKTYWDLDYPREIDRDMDRPDSYYIEQTREKLLEAVAFRLEADVPVGCYLSGGIDSCSMLGLAASMQQSPVKAFTISFDNKDYDEAHIAKEMADKVHADQEQIRLTANELYGENYIRTLWHAERTFYNTLGVAKWCMSHRVNECGYRVVVTGEGSDELFGGYPQFKRDMLRLGYHEDYLKRIGLTTAELQSYRALMEESNRLFKGAILSEDTVDHPAFNELMGFTPSWIQPWMQTLAIAKPLLSDDLQDELSDYDPIAAIAAEMNPDQLDGRHVLDQVQYTWSKTMLECQILNWGGDRVDMANSMESRPAFLDHHVAEMARDIPPHVRIRGNTEKWVLREAMKEILPEVLYKREKFAFMSPPAHTEKKKQDALKQLKTKFMNPEAVASTGIFDERRLRQFLTDYENDTNPVSLVRKDALINHLLGLQILDRMFVKGDGLSVLG